MALLTLQAGKGTLQVFGVGMLSFTATSLGGMKQCYKLPSVASLALKTWPLLFSQPSDNLEIEGSFHGEGAVKRIKQLVSLSKCDRSAGSLVSIVLQLGRQCLSCVPWGMTQ